MNLASTKPSAVDIQNHLYASFLDGKTADVALRIKGSWSAIYKLHRVVLIQSGFFRALFTAGFSESTPRIAPSNIWPEEIIVHFDDPNITRAAFEISISRLYGGGPALHIPASLIPTTTHPLTSSFPRKVPYSKAPDGHHLATPHFLLSLLATAVYLSIPSVASQALTSILNTIGPYTVIDYLNFACGKPIASFATRESELQAATGLEHVAQILDDQSFQDTIGLAGKRRRVAGTYRSNPTGSDSEAGSDKHADPEALMALEQGVPEPELKVSLHYGSISDRIGQACACWLARWGVDMLSYEEQAQERLNDAEAITPIHTRKRAMTIPFDTASSSNLVDSQEGIVLPKIWDREGLSPDWVAAIVSADTFFVRGERERYEFARSVVELRRRHGVIESEELEWKRMFEEGIFYENMTIEDLFHISRDVSLTTKQPFVSLSILQAALWTQSILRHRITSPSNREKELSITQTTAEVSSTNEMIGEPPKTYFAVTTNSLRRVGGDGKSGNSAESVVSMDQLFALPSPDGLSPRPDSGTVIQHYIHSESNYFGLLDSRFTAAACAKADPSGNARWTSYPPYRFAIEFWDINSVRDKNRLYSQTIFYAGSLFNVYVQVIRKKDQNQLGIYLHRQSTVDHIPPASAPSVLAIDHSHLGGNRPYSHVRIPSFPVVASPSSASSHSSSSPTHYSPSIHPPRTPTPPRRANGSTSPASSIASSPPSTTTMWNMHTLPATFPPVSPPQPFRDPRPSVSAYFSVTCASPTGSFQTRFNSSPDGFAIGSSWGWKSGSLITEYLDFADVQNHDTPPRGREVSLRATVLLGLV